MGWISASASVKKICKYLAFANAIFHTAHIRIRVQRTRMLYGCTIQMFTKWHFPIAMHNTWSNSKLEKLI